MCIRDSHKGSCFVEKLDEAANKVQMFSYSGKYFDLLNIIKQEGKLGQNLEIVFFFFSGKCLSSFG